MSQHSFKGLSPDQLENLLSDFLVDSWSYSSVTTFARNEKAYEMNYIYREPFKRSASAVSGNAYHEALEFYFSQKKEGIIADIVDLQNIAFDYLATVPANSWKLQKTTPNVEKCLQTCTKKVTSLLKNFFENIAIYDFKEIIAVELYCDEFLTVNGVDIPIPCHGKIDLVAVTQDGLNVIVDHKSKDKYSNEKEVALSIGKQAVTYYHLIFEKLNIKIDEVWFVENKASQNQDKSIAQLQCFKSEMTKDTVRLYDAMLYEPLRRMMSAVSDPEYVYLMNEDDNFVDKAEMHSFWAKTMISEVEDFNISESKKELVGKRLKKIRDSSLATINPKVIKQFKVNASNFIQFNLKDKNMTSEDKIIHILKTVGAVVDVPHKFEGISNDTFLLRASAGTQIASIQRYKLDIANALDVSSVRIKKDLEMYEGESYLSIEAPKKRTEDLLYDEKYLEDLKIPLGLDNYGRTIVWDLNNQSTPHALICGATGSGKSVNIISILEFALKGGINDVIIFDPKFEFTKYQLIDGIEVYNDIEDIETLMEFLVEEMNDKISNGNTSKKLVIFDEFADAISSSAKGNELKIYEDRAVGRYKNGSTKFKRTHVGTKNSLEKNLQILGQKGRSCGFRIVAATQRASVKVITGDTKVNFPVQICFRVPKEIDSKVVLGEGGAEALTGKGDGLVNTPEYLGIQRFQSFYKN